jgi:antitoxin (DNA-binding transcriptional repressor) of toxin-antitoxin stability system
MKTINVRELRALIPGLKEELAAQHELLLVIKGEPVARFCPHSQPEKNLLR